MPSPLRPPTQDRSRDTLDRLLIAFASLIERHDYEAITVAELVAKAGTSVGAFYARFQSKDGLLFALGERVLRENRDAMETALTDRAVARLDLAGVIGRYTRVMVGGFHRHRPVWIAVGRHVRGASRTALLAETRRFNDAVHGRFRELARARVDQIGHPDPEFAIEFGLFQASAAAREAVLSRSLTVYPIQPGLARISAEIARGWCGYLALDSRPSRRRAPRP